MKNHSHLVLLYILVTCLLCFASGCAAIKEAAETAGPAAMGAAAGTLVGGPIGGVAGAAIGAYGGHLYTENEALSSGEITGDGALAKQLASQRLLILQLTAKTETATNIAIDNANKIGEIQATDPTKSKLHWVLWMSLAAIAFISIEWGRKIWTWWTKHKMQLIADAENRARELKFYEDAAKPKV